MNSAKPVGAALLALVIGTTLASATAMGVAILRERQRSQITA